MLRQLSGDDLKDIGIARVLGGTIPTVTPTDSVITITITTTTHITSFRDGYPASRGQSKWQPAREDACHALVFAHVPS
jgi:hypothetical protein